MLNKLFLHFVDNVSGLLHIVFFAGNHQHVPASGNLYIERLAQKPKVTVGGAEQFELLIGRI
jgi:hypothetical protein